MLANNVSPPTSARSWHAGWCERRCLAKRSVDVPDVGQISLRCLVCVEIDRHLVTSTRLSRDTALGPHPAVPRPCPRSARDSGCLPDECRLFSRPLRTHEAFIHGMEALHDFRPWRPLFSTATAAKLRKLERLPQSWTPVVRLHPVAGWCLPAFCVRIKDLCVYRLLAFSSTARHHSRYQPFV